MRWRRLDRIFDPTDYELGAGCTEFAQSPQTLVFDDYVRIYFSSRARDPENGKYLSHVFYVDMQKDLSAVLRVATEPVISLGARGCFDEHGIFPLNVLRHRGKIFGYSCGWSRRVSVSVETAIGLLVSDDGGSTFRRLGDGPVLGASLHEPFLVGDPFVRSYEGKLHMWYIFGTRWERYSADEPPDRTYKIGHATSADGIQWVKEEARQIVADRLGPHESQALPSVIGLNGRYHMVFCYRQSSDFRTNPARGYRLGHAWSKDLVDWVRDDASMELSSPADSWDSDMMCYPHVFAADSATYLLYNGNEFGRHGFGAAVLE